MPKIGVNHHFSGGGNFVICSKLAGRRADGIHQPDSPQDIRPHPVSQVLDINITEHCEYFRFSFVLGVKMPEVVPQLRVGIPGLIHLPDTPVIAQEGIDRSDAPDARLQRSTSHRQVRLPGSNR